MRIVAITNQKGGCGKTTTAINLGASLVKKGNRVLLIDLDPQGHASLGLGMSNEQAQIKGMTMYNVLSDSVEYKATLDEAVKHLDIGLDVAPAHILLSTLEQELSNKQDSTNLLRRALGALKNRYNFIIIDTPPNLGFLTFNALIAATEVIIPIEASSFSLNGVERLFQMISLIKEKTNHRFLLVKALTTMYDRRTNYAKKVLGEIHSRFKDDMYKSVIGINVALKESASVGKPVFHYNRHAAGAKDYLALAEEVLADGVNIGPLELLQEARERAKEVRFTLNIPDAGRVYVVGDFNKWAIDDDSLAQRNADGRWDKAINLYPGRYRYKFVVDGRWMEDPQNSIQEPNPFGGLDSIMEVKE